MKFELSSALPSSRVCLHGWWCQMNHTTYALLCMSLLVSYCCPCLRKLPLGRLKVFMVNLFLFFSSVQPFQGLRQSCVKKPLTSTPGKTRNRKPQQDLANRSENKTDTAKALVSLHIRSSFNEENITGPSATH